MKHEPRSNPVLSETVALVRRSFFGLLVFSLGINLLVLTMPIFTLQIFERVLTSRNVDTLIMLSLLAAAGLLVMAMLEAVRGLILNRIGAWIERRLGAEALRGGIVGALRHDAVPGIQGLRDITTIRGFLTGPGMTPLMDAPWAPLFLAVLFILHPGIGVLATVGAVVLFGLAVGNEILTRGLQRQAGQHQMAGLGRAEAMFRNAEAVDAMGMRDALSGKWRAENDQAIDVLGRASDRTAVFSAASKFVRLGLQVSVMGIGAYLVIDGRFSPGAMIAGAIILSRALAPVEQAIGAWRGLIGARTAYGRLAQLLDRVPEPRDSMPLPRPEGHLGVEGVSFVVPGYAEPILKDVGFTVEPGQCIAVMGPSASGKTSLARLLVGNVRPSHGAVRIDGMNVFEWEASDRGRHVGYLPQDVDLFPGTVHENIARMTQGNPEAVVEAARIAGVHDMILHLPQGYDTRIGDGGVLLSAGQRQRIALARAVYGQPRLLVLDEPNANLDTEGEAALVKALETMKAGGTAVVVISHRSGILKAADLVLVLENGRVAALGPSPKSRAAGANSERESGSARKLRVVTSVGGVSSATVLR